MIVDTIEATGATGGAVAATDNVDMSDGIGLKLLHAAVNYNLDKKQLFRSQAARSKITRPRPEVLMKLRIMANPGWSNQP